MPNQPPSPSEAAARRLSVPGLLLRLAGLALLVVVLSYLVQEVTSAMASRLPAAEPAMMYRIALGATVLYALLLAVPFVPGVEIGLTLLGMMGASVAPMVYLGTVAGLLLAYGVGRLVPPEAVATGLRSVGLSRAARLIERTAPMRPEDRLRAMLATAPGRVLPFLLRHRYLALALALNLPGNVVLGGGGGLAMMAGLCRLYAPVPFLLTVLLAVAPVPLTVLLFGAAP